MNAEGLALRSRPVGHDLETCEAGVGDFRGGGILWLCRSVDQTARTIMTTLRTRKEDRNDLTR